MILYSQKGIFTLV